MLFNLKSMALPVLIGSTLALLGGCGSEKAESDPATNQMAQTNGSGEAASFPESLPVFGDGYPQSGAPCRRVGESEVTVDLMDDSADLVACPTKEQARVLGGKIVGLVDGFSRVSVPTGDANAGLPAAASQAKSALAEPPKDVVRGKGGLEEKCLKAVAAQGTKVIGTNRIEESEAATAIYVNVVGGQAPCRCLRLVHGRHLWLVRSGSRPVVRRVSYTAGLAVEPAGGRIFAPGPIIAPPWPRHRRQGLTGT